MVAQTDWINTRQQLGLVQLNALTPTIYVKVPVGQEDIAIKRIQNNPIVVWAEKNQIIHMQL